MKNKVTNVIEDVQSFKQAPKDAELKLIKDILIEDIRASDADVKFITCVWMRDEGGAVNFKVKISYDKELNSSEWTRKKHDITSYLFSSDVFFSGLKADSNIHLKLTMLNSKYNGKDNKLKNVF